MKISKLHIEKFRHLENLEFHLTNPVFSFCKKNENHWRKLD
jgi:hypothetical protein